MKGSRHFERSLVRLPFGRLAGRLLAEAPADPWQEG